MLTCGARFPTYRLVVCGSPAPSSLERKLGSLIPPPPASSGGSSKRLAGCIGTQSRIHTITHSHIHAFIHTQPQFKNLSPKKHMELTQRKDKIHKGTRQLGIIIPIHALHYREVDKCLTLSLWDSRPSALLSRASCALFSSSIKKSMLRPFFSAARVGFEAGESFSTFSTTVAAGPSSCDPCHVRV